VATVDDILVPDIGDFAGVEVIEILVKPGDRIEAEQSLLTLESDKATMEIPSPRAGLVREIKVRLGDRLGAGDPILTLEASDSPSKAPPAEAPSTSASAPEEPAPVPAATPAPVSAPRTGAAGTVPVPIPVQLPDVGDFHDIPVIEVLVAPGDHVHADQSVLTLESDKATMEIPVPQAGVVAAIAAKIGDKLNRGDLLLTLIPDSPAAAVEVPGTAAEEAEPGFAAAPAAKPPAPVGTPEPVPRAAVRMPGEKEPARAPILPRPADMAAIATGRTPHASPAVRRFARELGVDLRGVKGSGPKGRVLKGDVQGFVKRALTQGVAAAASGTPFQLPPAPAVDFGKFGPVETIALPRIKRLSGAHLHRCWLTIPHVTQFDEADITELEAFRQAQKDAAAAQGVKLTFLPLLLKAVAHALTVMPSLKASLTPDGEGLVMKRYTHIGVAVDTPNGLVVPVVRDADRKGVYQLARELGGLSDKAKAGKLLPGDMQGGCFSISSLGGIGGTAFTPIVNAPEVAILGISRAAMKPVWDGAAFAPRLMLPLSLSYDHRVVDGADGARFTRLLCELLGDIRRLLL
jgi:pyruvate dehydrogenase E2 component (dihydrolipoamide acetyltransferase)